MNRLSTRLVLSHLAVVLVGALATFLIVRTLAPSIFDRTMRGTPVGRGPGGGPGGGGPGGPGGGQVFREQFVSIVDQALLIGAGLGIVAAAVLGIGFAYRLARPIRSLGAATREIAAGRYAAVVPTSEVTELRQLSDDVAALARQLADTEARRVRLLGEVAHEMRTPLTVIDGYVEGMIDGVLPVTDEALGQLSEEARRLRRLSDDLSTLSRAEEGRLVMELSPLDLSGVARTAAERLRPQAEDAGLTLDLHLDEALPIDGDADRLAQVVTNLVGNALRATPEGGALTLRGRTEGDSAVLTVTDTGEGLSEADLTRIFERFYRVPGRRGADGETGSGIGLAIARGIARAHCGELSAASDGPDQGSTFTLRIPLHAGS